MKKLLLSVCLFASVQTFISCKKTELSPTITPEQPAVQIQQTGKYATNLDPDEKTIFAGSFVE